MKIKILTIGMLAIFCLTSISSATSINIVNTPSDKTDGCLNVDFHLFNPVISNENFIVLTSAESNFEKKLYDQIDFEISVNNQDGSPILSYSYDISISPTESLSHNKNGNKIIGSFITTKKGLYSLNVGVQDKNNNIEQEIFYYFVEPTGKEILKYYFRGLEPTHGQPAYWYAKSMLFEPPTEEENCGECSGHIQTSPDDIPSMHPISLLTTFDINCWYAQWRPDGIIGIQRFVTDSSTEMDMIKDVPICPKHITYRWLNRNFYVSWPMNKPESWYLLSIKLIGGNPIWITKPSRPSYTDFTYKYTKTPEIKSMTNTDIIVLSATSHADSIKNATIILRGTGTTNLVVQMPYSSINYFAEFNNEDCEFTQKNGELNFNLNLDTSNTEHLLYIHTDEKVHSKSKVNNRSFLGFLEDHPHMFLLLRLMLKL